MLQYSIGENYRSVFRVPSDRRMPINEAKGDQNGTVLKELSFIKGYLLSKLKLLPYIY